MRADGMDAPPALRLCWCGARGCPRWRAHMRLLVLGRRARRRRLTRWWAW